MATIVGQRSPLFWKQVKGGLPVILDTSKFTGNVFYVDSAVGTDGDGYGSEPDKPLATIDYAIGKCTASQGDIILVLPGHAETVTAAITCDIAGIRIVGLGEGTNRPALTGNAVIDVITITANNVTIEGLRFVTPGAAVDSLINVAAARATIRRCIFELGANIVDAVTITAAGELPTFEDNEVIVSANGPDSWLKFEGVVDRPLVRNNQVIGSDGTNAFDDGVFDFNNQAVTNPMVYENDFDGADAATTVFANVGSLVGDAFGPNRYSGSAVDGDTVFYTSVTLADDAITAAKIAANAIGASEIADNAIDAGALGADCITNAKIADNAIAAENIAANAITAAKIADAAIDAATFAAGAIDAAAIATGAIDADAIADNAIDAGAIAANAITAAKIADAAIDAATFAAGAIDAAAIATGAIDADAIADNAIDAGAIAADAITAAKIANAAIDAATFAAGAIDAAAIANAAIDAATFAAGAIDAAAIATGAIDADAIADNAIDAGAIAADAITNAKLADNALASEQFAVSAGEKTCDGIVVTRATAAVPQSSSATLFTVTGLVLLKRIVGRVTTVLGAATPNNSKLKLDTTGPGATTDLCGDLDLDAEAAATILQITGTFANAMVATLDLPIAKQQAVEIVLPPGNLQLECDGSDGGTGRIQWSVTYVPLEAGASMAAA